MRVLNLSFGNKILFIVGPDKSLAPPGPDGAHLGMKINRCKFDGYSEAWTKKSLNVTSIKQIFDWVYEDESLPPNLVKEKTK